jgi:hypothetical protein
MLAVSSLRSNKETVYKKTCHPSKVTGSHYLAFTSTSFISVNMWLPVFILMRSILKSFSKG